MDLPSVLSLWADHFSVLGASRCASDPKLDTYVSSVADLDAKSFSSQDSHTIVSLEEIPSSFKFGDTVEYPVLLHHPYNAGKTWRLIKNWYSNSSCVRISDTSSRAFPISRGVKQGSVLSPVLFLLVIDPILLALKNKPCGLNICGLYLGAFCHADDIHTLASSKSDCSHHISSVEDFASSIGSQAKC